MTRQNRAALIGISLSAFALRIHGLFANSFHADEALFASWAREIAVWRDPLLLGQAVDKPPLLFYLQAMFYPIQGPVEWAARLPNFIVSCLLVPLVALVVWLLYQDELAAVAASLLAALSPLAVQFSGTAFTDPMLTALLLASITAMAIGWRRRLNDHSLNGSPYWKLAGFSFGLAAAVKYQAWLFLPLIAALGFLFRLRRRLWWNWLLGLMAVMVPLAIWTAARSSAVPLWSNQLSNFGGLRLSYSWEIWSRLGSWWRLLPYIVPLPFLVLSLLALCFRQREPMTKRWDTLFFSFVVGYLLLHWAAAIPVWDRYLLPIAPLLFVLAGRGASHLAGYLSGPNSPFGLRPTPSVLAALVLATLLILSGPAALSARKGVFPIGGTPGADQGAAAIAASLAELPYGSVLYDHWYGWQWRYHLFDKRIYAAWFPNPDALAEQLGVFGRDGNPHFLALPDSAAALPVTRAVAAAGFGLELVTVEPGVPTNSGGILLYRIIVED